jgi:DNA-directed RNA polymerase specialized sigma24 family protein
VIRPVDAEPEVSDNALRGDAVDFDAVFRCHHDRLLRLTGLLCGDAGWAEDVVAEVFARLLRRWEPGAIRDVDAYLRRAVVNEVAGEFRRRTRARKPAPRLAVAPSRSSEDEVGERDQVW